MRKALRIQITVSVNSRGLKRSTRARGAIQAKNAPVCGWDQAYSAFSPCDRLETTEPEEVSIDQVAADYDRFLPMEEDQPLLLTAEEFSQVGVAPDQEVPCDGYDPDYFDVDDL
jgi:hypothetical protein